MTHSSGVISQITNNSAGSGPKLTQSAGGLRPLLISGSGPNGADYAQFDGSDDYMVQDSFSMADPLSLYLVMRYRSYVSNRYFIDDTGVVNAAFSMQGTSPRSAQGASFGHQGTLNSMAANTWGILNGVFADNASKYRLNKLSYIDNSAYGVITGMTGRMVLGTAGNLNAANSSAIDVVRVLRYSVAHNTTEADAVVDYLMSLYGI